MRFSVKREQGNGREGKGKGGRSAEEEELARQAKNQQYTYPWNTSAALYLVHSSRYVLDVSPGWGGKAEVVVSQSGEEGKRAEMGRRD